jgi:hypothetical protein
LPSLTPPDKTVVACFGTYTGNWRSFEGTTHQSREVIYLVLYHFPTLSISSKCHVLSEQSVVKPQQSSLYRPVLSVCPFPLALTMPAPIETYWLPGFELSRRVVIEQIRYLLGPTASARQYSHQGSDGFMITGPKLTEVSRRDPRQVLSS